MSRSNDLTDVPVPNNFIRALTYISVFATNKEAAIYNALIGLSWGVGAILGPVIGGAFSVSSATWRWVSPEHFVHITHTDLSILGLLH